MGVHNEWEAEHRVTELCLLVLRVMELDPRNVDGQGLDPLTQCAVRVTH